MLSLGFAFKFDENRVNIHLESTYYGCGYISTSLIVLNIDYSSYNNFNGSICFTSHCDIDSITWYDILGHIG